MANQNGPLIDMTPDGRIIDPPKPTLGMILLRLAAFAVFLCIGALVFWTMIFMLPVLLVLGVIGYFVARSQMRRFR
jgi:uncharacterized membrane protein